MEPRARADGSLALVRIALRDGTKRYRMVDLRDDGLGRLSRAICRAAGVSVNARCEFGSSKRDGVILLGDHQIGEWGLAAQVERRDGTR